MTSPATQEPCPKCGGSGWVGVPEQHRAPWQQALQPCSCRFPAPPSQRAALLTQELESAMAKLRKSAAAEQNHRLSEAEAAALLQHIAALTQRVEALEVALDPRQWDEPLSDAWHRNIPDVQQAFRALRDAALSQEPRDG